ncbi:hypothetical protein CRUP_012958, partial [Coryphaenoides rupestris]
VNGIDLRQATHEEALGVLRLSTQRVRLCVFRHQEAYREEDLNDTGIFVSEIQQQGVADKDGRLVLGDQILSINGEDVRAASPEHAERLLQSCGEVVYLEVARFKAGLQYRQGNQSEDSDCSTVTPSSACDAALCHQRETDRKAGNYDCCTIRKVVIDKVGDRLLSINGAPTEGMTHVEAGAMLKSSSGSITLHTIALERGSSGLGFSVVGGFGSPHGDLPIYVKTVFNK